MFFFPFIPRSCWRSSSTTSSTFAFADWKRSGQCLRGNAAGERKGRRGVQSWGDANERRRPAEVIDFYRGSVAANLARSA